MTFGSRNEHVFLGRDFGHDRDYSENVATMIDEEVKGIISYQYDRVKDLLTKHRPHMDAIVKVLLEKETLDVKEVEAIIAEVDSKLSGKSSDKPASDDTPQNPTGLTGSDSNGVDITECVVDPDDGGDGPKPEFKPKFA
jgi:cell division protease FtsH